MAESFDLVVKNGTLVTPGGRVQADLGVRAGRIVALGDLGRAAAAETVDAAGLHVLPGVIDSQVHFREPGLEHKEDLATGTRAAVAGGVTAIFEMPNTKPLTVTRAALQDKLDRAAGRAWCDYAFYVGGTPGNPHDLADLEEQPGCAGVKIFMGSSTGDLLVEEDAMIDAVLAHGRRRVAVHAEDEPLLRERRALLGDNPHPRLHPLWRNEDVCLRATERLLALAIKRRRRVHVLHVTTAQEIDLLGRHKDLATVETTPNHLTMAAPECYDRLGTYAQMNPSVKGPEHRERLWRGIAEGIIDVIGSDHAPHTREEKDKPYPNSPSGMTGVQTLVPVMLDHVAAGRLSLERFVDLTSAGPARIFNIAGKGRLAIGYDADLTLVDLKARREITDSWIESRCGWTPFHGMTVTGWPMATVVRGRIAMRDGAILGQPSGEAVRFLETL
ncbi:MAG TPA: dihydroorotase [Alphaproteobacteria bacterium]|nr:dihydroorotase [Alphaproteobacteria bacterium]